jgi:Protein of unknown function (DUF3892)
MADVQVTCITKPHPQSAHEHITDLGNPRGGWKWSREEVIASIDPKTNTFFVIDPHNGKRADVGVVRPAGRPACTRTTEVSIICTAASQPAASASMIRSQTPARRHRTKRL